MTERKNKKTEDAIRTPVRNFHSGKNMPTRVFDVIVNGDRVDLEVKTDKNKYETIPWEDVVYQVGVAMKKAANE